MPTLGIIGGGQLGSMLASAAKKLEIKTIIFCDDENAPGQKFSKHLQVHNPELGKKLHISDIRSRTNNDLLEINLSLTSTYKKTLKLQYQFTWFDKEGFVIEAGKSPWKPLDLHGMQTETVPGLAPTTNVASFSLYVREVPEKFFKF